MWDDIATWFQSPAGARVLQTAIVPAIAILVAGVLAALIGRAAARSVLARGDRDQAVSAVAALVESARVAADPESARDGRRRVARLRTEADVRMRLLPLPGAALAADWAAMRIDALQQDDGATGDGAVAEVRDRLVEWSRRPGRAKRLFATAPAAPAKRRKQDDAEQTSAPRTEGSAAPQRSPQPEAGSTGAPAVVSATGAPARAAAAPAAASAPATAAPAAAAPPAAPVVPAWQRTRAGEQLREQREGRVPPVEEEPAPATAPVKVPHAHRAEDAPVTRAAEPPRPVEPPKSEAPRSQEAPPKKEQPAWLDDYDDEAQVTQNLTFKTPPPIAATSVRDRRPTGQDIVPRG